MSLPKIIVQALILSACLAAYDLFIRTAYETYAVGVGVPAGFGASMLGYFMTIIVAYIFTRMITRKM